jgi:hypothetical protein
LRSVAVAILAGLLIGASLPAAERQDIPIEQLGKRYQLIGKLHEPIGKVLEVEGVVVEGPFKGYEGGLNLRVQRIQGQATQEDIQIVISPFFRGWGEKSIVDGELLPKPEIGDTYRMKGYETGEYVGEPPGIFENERVPIQDTAHYFRERFVVFKARRIDPVSYTPSEFTGRKALFQGKAVSKGGRGLLVGDAWDIVVIPAGSWPAYAEGKLVETYGMYNPEPNPDSKVYRLLDGTWHLADLEDQLGRDVELRGRARSLNGVWWFHYRGTDLYVENMESLPRWTDDNHWRPMVIRGRLEKAELPRLDQVSMKENRDLKEYFIVRRPSWEPLDALLSVERPLAEPE